MVDSEVYCTSVDCFIDGIHIIKSTEPLMIYNGKHLDKVLNDDELFQYQLLDDTFQYYNDILKLFSSVDGQFNINIYPDVLTDEILDSLEKVCKNHAANKNT